ncbi:MAG: ACP S-malonyltransferase [Holosporales bacterium]|jgi:[acyl-carrier-protein] S-malonyltransferase|nr:ACP S-malonyltransferase [Holosporales bacterium]
MSTLLSNIALIFPGQGSQSMGMAKTIYDRGFTQTVKIADRVFGSSLTDVMFNGPEDQLNQTIYTQPAILTASVMIWEYVQSFGALNIICAAGHSVGEYSALVAAGVMSFEVALSLVKIRASAMAEASPRDPSGAPLGAMCAVLGGELDVLAKIINEVCHEYESLCSIANYNCPGQTVITGLREHVDKVRDIAISRGAKKCVMLPISGAFHSKWMMSATERLSDELADMNFEKPTFPIISSVTGKRIASDSLNILLPTQVIAPVRWSECMDTMVKMGADVFIEVGSGSVLTGISKRCAPEKTFISMQTANDVETFMHKRR